MALEKAWVTDLQQPVFSAIVVQCAANRGWPRVNDCHVTADLLQGEAAEASVGSLHMYSHLRCSDEARSALRGSRRTADSGPANAPRRG